MQGYDLDIRHIPGTKKSNRFFIQQILYPNSCKRMYWEGRVKFVKSMDSGLINSEYQQGHQRNRFRRHSVNYFSRVKKLQIQLTEIREGKIISN